MKPRTNEEYVQIDQLPWKPFPDVFSQGGIRWKLLHVSPESGAWTAIFDCPAGSSFAPHIHNGPGEYFLTRGKADLRGGKDAGGDRLLRRATAMNRPTRGTTRPVFRSTASST
jgi:acetylacetone-cleaving enzyme